MGFITSREWSLCSWTGMMVGSGFTLLQWRPMPIKKLSGLISLWMKFFVCTYSILLIICKSTKTDTQRRLKFQICRSTIIIQNKCDISQMSWTKKWFLPDLQALEQFSSWTFGSRSWRDPPGWAPADPSLGHYSLSLAHTTCNTPAPRSFPQHHHFPEQLHPIKTFYWSHDDQN